MPGWATLLDGEVVRPLPIASVVMMKYLSGRGHVKLFAAQ
jgi:hypothetical protein